MDTRLEVLKSIEKAMEFDKEVSFGQFVAYISSVDDLAYMPDAEIKRLVDDRMDSVIRTNEKIKQDRESKVPSVAYLMPQKLIPEGVLFEPCYCSKLHGLTEESEAEGYRRYKERTEGKIFFRLEERLSYYDFLCRFAYEFNFPREEYKEWHVVNHAISFWDIIPYCRISMYVCGWRDDKYTFLNINSSIRDALRLFEFIADGSCLHHDTHKDFVIDAEEWVVLVLNSGWLCRAACYATRVQFGMRVSPAKKEVELYSPDQAVDIFHELFGKCDTIINGYKILRRQ